MNRKAIINIALVATCLLAVVKWRLGPAASEIKSVARDLNPRSESVAPDVGAGESPPVDAAIANPPEVGRQDLPKVAETQAARSASPAGQLLIASYQRSQTIAASSPIQSRIDPAESVAPIPGPGVAPAPLVPPSQVTPPAPSPNPLPVPVPPGGIVPPLPVPLPPLPLSLPTPVPLPLVFNDVALAAVPLAPEQVAEVQRLRDDFVQQIGPQDVHDLSYLVRWNQAQPNSNEALRARVGWDAFNLMAHEAIQTGK